MLFGRSVVSDSDPWTATCQASLSFTISQNLLKLLSIELVMPSNHLVLFHPFLFLPSILPRIRVFPNQVVFASSGESIGASASASVLPKNIQDWFPLRVIVWSPCSPSDSQGSSPTPQFKSINSLMLSLFNRPTLTSTHDHWKNHSFD